MPREMARSDSRPNARVTRGAGSGQHLASVLQEGRENANIDAGLGFIWRISVNTSVVGARGGVGIFWWRRPRMRELRSNHLGRQVDACLSRFARVSFRT
jgi:hypothetical protein